MYIAGAILIVIIVVCLISGRAQRGHDGGDDMHINDVNHRND